MARYYKEINGVKKFYKERGIITMPNGATVMNPTVEMLLEAGYQEYVYAPEPYVETFEDKKRNKINEIEMYDRSFEVNRFYLNDQSRWLSKDERAELGNRFAAEDAVGVVNTTIWFGNESVEMPVSFAKKLIRELEVYAAKCYDTTKKHLIAVEAIETEEELEAYDYRTNYPETLTYTI